MSPIAQHTGLTIRSDRRFAKGQFQGFRLSVRLNGVLMEQVDLGANLEKVEAEREKLRMKWEPKA